MTTEQKKTLEALQIAIQMEIDGREYYQKTSQASTNQLGKELFQKLAKEEDFHRQKFEKIYGGIQKKEAWPKIGFQPDGGKNLRTIFARASEALRANVESPATELEAIQTAIGMEIKSYDFYVNCSKKASYQAEKDFFEAVAGEEREHHLILLDYYEYLKDPAGWFVKEEHPSLD